MNANQQRRIQERCVIWSWHYAQTGRCPDLDIGANLTVDQHSDLDALEALLNRLRRCDLVALERIFDRISGITITAQGEQS